MTRATTLDFEIAIVHSRNPFSREAGVAQMRRQGLAWPWHIEIGDDFINWAAGSAWVRQLEDGSVEFWPADGQRARYRRSHLTTGGTQHYDLAEIDGERVPERPIQ